MQDARRISTIQEDQADSRKGELERRSDLERRNSTPSSWIRPKDQAIREGKLEWCIETKETAKRTWEKRYVLLTASDMVFLKEKKSDKPIGLFNLADSVAVVTENKDRKFCFQVIVDCVNVS